VGEIASSNFGAYGIDLTAERGQHRRISSLRRRAIGLGSLQRGARDTVMGQFDHNGRSRRGGEPVCKEPMLPPGARRIPGPPVA
jgi:hypothetical protein